MKTRTRGRSGCGSPSCSCDTWTRSGRPFLAVGQPPITAEDYLEMLALGEMLAETDRGCVADPDYYRTRPTCTGPSGRGDVGPARRGDGR